MRQDNPIQRIWQRLGPAAPLLLLMGSTAVLGVALLVVDPLFVLAGFIALLVGGLVLSQPYYGVLLYLALLYVRPGDMIPALEPLRLTLLGVVLLAGAFALQVLVYRRAKTIITTPMIFMGLFLTAIVLSLPASYYRTITMTRFTDTLRLVFMTFLIVHLVDTVPRVRGFMGALSLIMAGLSTALVIRYFAMPWTRVANGGSGGMIGGFLGDGNDFALAQNVILPWTIMMAFSVRSRLWRLVFSFGALMGVIAVTLTFSRGGVLGLVALLGVLYLVWIARSRRWVLGAYVAIIVLVVGAIAFLAFAPENFLDRMTSIKDYEKDESALGRLDAWRAGAEMFIDHPFVGVGAGAFTVAYGMDYKPPNAIAANWREAHNVYVQVLGEMGMVGIICMLGMIISMLALVSRTRMTHLPDLGEDKFFHGARAALVGSIAAWAISAMFLSVGYYPHLYVLVMLATCLERLARYHAIKLSVVEEVEEV